MIHEKCKACGGPACRECGMAINQYRIRTGLCRSCVCKKFNKDPEIIAKQQATKRANKEAKRRELDELQRSL